MTDNPGIDPVSPDPPTYPDGTVGVLMKQRDDLLRSVDSDRSMAEMYSARADATAATVQQLQDTIDSLS